MNDDDLERRADWRGAHGATKIRMASIVAYALGLFPCCLVFAAVACLVFAGGFHSFLFPLCVGLYALVSTIAGGLHLWRMGRRCWPHDIRIFALAGLKLGPAFIVLSAVVLVPLVPTVRRLAEPGPRGLLQCRHNLMRLGLALEIYGHANGGWGPTIEPEARQLANAAGIASGSVLAFRDRDGQWRPSGLGRLYQEGFLMRAYKGEVLYCPAISGKDSPWIDSFRYDPDDWPLGDDSEATPGQCMLGPTDRDGVGELPGNPSVMITSYLLRTNPDNAWGSWRMGDLFGVAVVSDLLFFGSSQAVFNHPQEYNVLFSDGSWKTYEDPAHVVRDACAAKAGTPDPDAAASDIFETFFDPFYMTDPGPIHRVSPAQSGELR